SFLIPRACRGILYGRVKEARVRATFFEILRAGATSLCMMQVCGAGFTTAWIIGQTRRRRRSVERRRLSLQMSTALPGRRIRADRCRLHDAAVLRVDPDAECLAVALGAGDISAPFAAQIGDLPVSLLLEGVPDLRLVGRAGRRRWSALTA